MASLLPPATPSIFDSWLLLTRHSCASLNPSNWGSRHSCPLREQESIRLVVNTSSPDGFLLPKGTGMTGKQLRLMRPAMFSKQAPGRPAGTPRDENRRGSGRVPTGGFAQTGPSGYGSYFQNRPFGLTFLKDRPSSPGRFMDFWNSPPVPHRRCLQYVSNPLHP